MTRAVGIDLSKYQGTFNPDLATQPIDFVIQRMSYGLRADERLSQIWDGVRKIPCRGAYHYYSTGVPWKAQADFFLELTHGKKFRVLVVDYEHSYNNLNDKTALELEKFLNYLFAMRSGKKILGYSGTYVYRDDILSYVDLLEWDWMFARYPWFPKPQTGRPKYPLGMPDRPWTKWQYTDRAKGILYGCNVEQNPKFSPFVDLDVFNGTVEELEEYYKKDVPEPPPPQPPLPLTCEEKVDRLVSWAKTMGYEE